MFIILSKRLNTFNFTIAHTFTTHYTLLIIELRHLAFTRYGIYLTGSAARLTTRTRRGNTEHRCTGNLCYPTENKSGRTNHLTKRPVNKQRAYQKNSQKDISCDIWRIQVENHLNGPILLHSILCVNVSWTSNIPRMTYLIIRITFWAFSVLRISSLRICRNSWIAPR